MHSSQLKVLSIIIYAFLLCAVQTFAQEKTIVTRDITTHAVIKQMSYVYDGQKGKGNDLGQITLHYREGIPLLLTHISFSELFLSGPALQQAFHTGIIYLEPVSLQTLSPVSVYALKGKKPQKLIRLENGDWVQHDAGQVLQQIPGFSAVRKSGAFGFDPVYRGFKHDQLNILSDGALTSVAACPNRMDPPTSQVMINQVQQIEVLKGPHSFRYGPAMGAIINFKSTEPEFSIAPAAFGRINTGFESNGEVYRTEGMAGMRNRKLQIIASGSYSKGHDYKDGKDRTIPAKFSRGAISLNTAVNLAKDHLLQFTVNRNFASNTAFPTLMMDLLSDDTWMLQASYKVSPKTKWYKNWQTQLYTSAVDHSMGNELRPASKNIFTFTDAATITAGGRTELTIQKNNHIAYIGADAKYETADGNRTRKMLTGPMTGRNFTDTLWQDGAIFRSGIFADWHLQTGLLKVSLSGRVDVITGEAQNPDTKYKQRYGNNKNTDVNSSFSAGISRQFNTSWFVGIWVGRGVRSASLSERFINSLPIGLDPYEMLGNPHLKPEANNQADVTISYKKGKGGIEINTYASIISDYISSIIATGILPRTTAPGVRQYINIKSARMFGFEFSWLQQLMPQLNQQLSITYTHGQNNRNDKPLPEIIPAELKYKLEGSYLERKLMPFVVVRHVVKQNRVADNFGERVTPAFTTCDAGAKFSPLKNMNISVLVSNLFDKAYREHLSRFINPELPLNSPGRSQAVMAAYEF